MFPEKTYQKKQQKIIPRIWRQINKNIEISNGISDNSKSYKFDAPFDANTKEYTITVPDYEDSVCVKAGLEESVPDGTEIKANYTDTNGESKEIIISGNDELGKKLGKIIEKGTVDNKFVLTAAYSKVVEKYTFNIKRQTTLKGITFANEKQAEIFPYNLNSTGILTNMK